MTIVTLDSTNLEAVLADARGESPPDLKEEGEVKDEGKETESTDPDDVEGEDGLTPREKKELSAKMQKAIGKRHREKREAEEFAAAQYNERKLADQRAAALQDELDKLKKPAEQEQEATEPKRTDFATDAEFEDAKIDWKVDQKLKARDVEDSKKRAQQAMERVIADAKGRVTKAIELVPDFVEVTSNADIEIPPVVAGYMQKSPLFAELGYHLAKNPDIVLSLNKLPPDEQLVQIGEIKATLKPFSESTKDSGHDGKSSKAATEGVKPSETTVLEPSKPRKAAPVISPLNANGSAVEKAPEDMNIRETITDWSKSNKVNFGLRKRH